LRDVGVNPYQVRRIIEECYERAKELLQQNHAALGRIAEELLKVEVLEGKRLDELLAEARAEAETPA
ncbi:MAG: hypothetical protein ACE5LQ_08135, partial [Candidatus Bipolaricaulia bacterium]